MSRAQLADAAAQAAHLAAEAEAQALRANIASAWLNHLHDPRGALDAAMALVDDPGSDDAVCGLLSRIVASPTADDDVRKREFELLDLALDFLGPLAERLPLELGDAQLQVGDVLFEDTYRGRQGAVLRLQSRHHRLERDGVIRQRCGRGRHAAA